MTDEAEPAAVVSVTPAARRARRSSLRAVVAAAAMATAAALAVGATGGFDKVAHALLPRPDLPRLGQVPSFRLVDQSGAAFTSDSMMGRVNVVDFVFTRCRASCPRLTSHMAELQSKLATRGSDAKLVSFSVDPENDTPPVLADYARKAHADPARWTFVTGGADDVARAVVLGFKVSAAKVATGAGDYEVTHGNWFVLVDQAGNLRGYYPTEEPGQLDKLVADVARLEKR